jgi:hypothetical protein
VDWSGLEWTGVTMSALAPIHTHPRVCSTETARVTSEPRLVWLRRNRMEGTGQTGKGHGVVRAGAGSEGAGATGSSSARVALAQPRAIYLGVVSSRRGELIGANAQVGRGGALVCWSRQKGLCTELHGGRRADWLAPSSLPASRCDGVVMMSCQSG